MARSGDRAPVMAEFTSYHRSAGRWTFGSFLPAADRHVLTRVLTPEERVLKRRLLGCYASQRAVLRDVPLDFERFRIAPRYDFRQPPHAGPLLYEQDSWSVTGEEWRERAGAALAALEGPRAPKVAFDVPVRRARAALNAPSHFVPVG
jgi:hypothetical protein